LSADDAVLVYITSQRHYANPNLAAYADPLWPGTNKKNRDAELRVEEIQQPHARELVCQSAHWHPSRSICSPVRQPTCCESRSPKQSRSMSRRRHTRVPRKSGRDCEHASIVLRSTFACFTHTRVCAPSTRYKGNAEFGLCVCIVYCVCVLCVCIVCVCVM
jgi:hypothetical protein